MSDVTEKQKSRRRGRVGELRYQSLLEGALELFSERDYADVTIKDIAAKAGINTALIYYYFENKEALFRATLECAIEKFIEYYQGLRERHSDPVDLINDWFDTHCEATRNIQQLLKIMLDYSSTGKQAQVIDEIIKQFYEEEQTLLSDAIEEGIRQGSFRKVDSAQAATFASTYLDGIIARSLIIQGMDIQEAVDNLKLVFWEHLNYRQ